VLFWKIIDPQKGCARCCRLPKRDQLGLANGSARRHRQTMLCDMLEGRDKISSVLRTIIDERTEPWASNVISVEVKDVLIPPALENAMSMQARRRESVRPVSFLGFGASGGREVCRSCQDLYQRSGRPAPESHEHAVRRLKQNSTIVIVPSSAIETMQLVACRHDRADHGHRAGTR